MGVAEAPRAVPAVRRCTRGLGAVAGLGRLVDLGPVAAAIMPVPVEGGLVRFREGAGMRTAGETQEQACDERDPDAPGAAGGGGGAQWSVPRVPMAPV